MDLKRSLTGLLVDDARQIFIVPHRSQGSAVLRETFLGRDRGDGIDRVILDGCGIPEVLQGERQQRGISCMGNAGGKSESNQWGERRKVKFHAPGY